MIVAGEPVVQVDNLSFAYDGSTILEDVNLSIAAGDFVSIVGPNGAGKTTLLKLLLGMMPPTRGRVAILGQSAERARPQIGYMPQHINVDLGFPVNVLDVVLMGRLNRRRAFGPFRREDKQAADDALREVDLFDLRNRHFGALSGGQRQRVLIARALVSEPRILMLDEPTSNLDLSMERELYEVLKRLNQKMTIIMVSHDLGFVSQFVKTVVCVKRWVAVHPTSEITSEIIKEIFGDVKMVRHDQRCAEGDLECLRRQGLIND